MHDRIKRGLATLAVPVMAAGLLASAASPASAGPASAGSHLRPAATTICNNQLVPCTDVFSLLLFKQNNQTSYTMNVVSSGGLFGGLAGSEINLSPDLSSRTSEDFIMTNVGTVGDLCGAPGATRLSPASYACLNYASTDPVYQQEFAPDGSGSGFCVGAASAASGQPVRLERCGSVRTLLVGDLGHSSLVPVPPPFGPLVALPVEYAASTRATGPLVMTLDTRSWNPADGLFLEREHLTGGSVPDDQMFIMFSPVSYTG